MNPLLSTKTNSSYLSFNQLKPHCIRLHNNLLSDSGNTSGQRERVRLEQQLWAEVKLLRNFKDQNLLNYLIGFYHSLLYRIAREPSLDDLFQYHVLIRLGDLNRYKQCDKAAKYYYSNARNLFPLFGHAYNQLALILAKPEILPENYYKCCYYYARAAKSSERSLETIAESNLRMAAVAYDGDILCRLLNGETSTILTGSEENPDDSSGSEPRKSRKLFDGMPKTAVDWFYVMVVAICVDNIQLVAKHFLDFTRENFALQRSTLMTPGNGRHTSIYCDRDGYIILASLDVFLDWLKLSSQGTSLIASVSGELRKIRSYLQSTLASLKYESRNSMSRENLVDNLGSQPISPSGEIATKHIFGINNLNNLSRESIGSELRKADQSLSSSGGQMTQMALPHDYTLRGFRPLDQVHSSIIFCSHKKLVSMINERAMNQIENLSSGPTDSSVGSFVDRDRLKQLLQRITSKMDGFGARLKRNSRNIALESILAGIGDP